MIQIKFKKLDEKAVIPKYASEGAACFDLHILLEEKEFWYRHFARQVIVNPRSQLIARTGLAVEIPEGYEMQIRPRSGLAYNSGITIVNAPGTVDSDYRGEIKVILYNLSNKSVTIDHLDRICQCKIAAVPEIEITEVNELAPTERGEKGWGSTGN